MKKRTSDFWFIMIMAIVICAIVVLPVGYVMNIVKLCHCDFASPYKAEIVRGVGIAIPPVGGIAGYMSIDDTVK